MVRDSISGLLIGDSSSIPSILTSQPPQAAIQNELDSMILSASGWRKIFSASGDEEDDGEAVKAADIMLAGLVGLSLADYLIPALEKSPEISEIAVACDSRPTGTLLADAMMRVLRTKGFSIRYLFIASAPEVMAYARREESIDAFAYISASHNPIGHNGFKFGLKTGGVLDGRQAAELTRIFRNHVANPGSCMQAWQLILTIIPEKMNSIFNEVAENKAASLQAYREFSQEVLTDSSESAVLSRRMDELRERVGAHRLGILGELNGSARSVTIDREFLEDLGCQVTQINDIPRQIAHRIVPEGRSLNMCRDELETLHGRNPAYILGYVPDNDGDRGNIVYINREGRAEILEAQTVFALVALAESSWLEYTEATTGEQSRAVIAVNGPTSMRIDEIAAAFGMETFRAEVGEANVVGLARELRGQGYLVRLMGEGSNGGNITHPAAVRDPLNTLGSIVKLLSLRGGGGRKGLFELWCERRGYPYREDFGLSDVLDSLPPYVTTSAYEDRALMKISTVDHRRLKAGYETVFTREYPQRREELLERWGLASWTEVNNEGTNERIGFGPEFRSGDHRGGMKILFSDRDGAPAAYMWMRGSGTEPVFRVLVDVKGARPELEAYLLDWHRSMIETADRG